MGTLTGNLPRLDGHCSHKLPTSCRLTASPTCCACQDRRSHSPSYSVYVDGVGYVARGTRWQAYCWYCQEFWKNRIVASGIPFTQSRIPEHPNQDDFLQKWFTFYNGRYRKEDSTVEFCRLRFESWSDVSPGRLPRLSDDTVSEVDAAFGPAAVRWLQDINTPTMVAEESTTPAEPHQDLDNFLDDLIEEVSDTVNTVLPSSTPTMEIPTLEPAQSFESARRQRRAARAQQRRDTLLEERIRRRELQNILENPRSSLDHGSAPDPAMPTASPRRGTAAERMTRVFGSMEDIQREDYQSPLNAMFTRAWGRYSQAESDRTLANQTSQQQQQENAGPSFTPHLSQLMNNPAEGDPDARRPEESNVVQQEERRNADQPRPAMGSQAYRDLSVVIEAMSADVIEPDMDIDVYAVDGIDNEILLAISRAPQRMETQRAEFRGFERRIFRRDSPQPLRTLDSDADRPPPLSDEEMTMKMDCKVCYSQKATQALLPCGHMAMCGYCADIQIPVMNHARTTPKNPARCPICRKSVNSVVRIHY